MTATDYAIGYKLNRGVRKLHALRRTIERYLASNANGVINDFESESGYLIVRGFSKRPPPPTCAALIGEILYHERGALDYMACELARLNGNVVDKQVEWPIFCDRDDFRNPASGNLTRGIRNRIGLIHPKYQTIIEDEQPFQGRYGKPEDDPLAMLYTLSNYDRHQFIHLTSVVTSESFHNFTPPEAAARFQQISVTYGAFKSQAEIARFQILDGPAVDVNVNSNVRLDVAFGDGGPYTGQSVVTSLASIGLRIGEMLKRIVAVP